jgi:phosphoserine phosphatase RsbU/P
LRVDVKTAENGWSDGIGSFGKTETPSSKVRWAPTIVLIVFRQTDPRLSLPEWLEQKLSTYKRYVGISIVNSQLLLLAIASAIAAIQWLLLGHASFASTLIYTFFAGNAVTILLALCEPLYDQPFPRDWVVFIALLVPISAFAGTLGGVLNRLVLGRPLSTLANWKSGDIPYSSLICAVVGLATYTFASNRTRLQAANAQLVQQVQYGRQALESQASELRDAFEIQSSLLPRSVPQIAGVEISCAWQPARTVSGDYFDVLVLSDTRIAFCLADVSGKGMSAALITANLQATLRAFGPDEPSPARLCHRLNQARCASLPTGRFVTLVYGILDRSKMTLTYELAGHNPPLLLRGSDVIELTGSGPVLGMLPGATFSDQTIALRVGDLFLLSTDGVTEAFNPAGEEFGEARLIAAARSSAMSAHSIRTAVMHSVTDFAENNFHDDASLLIVQVLP